MKYRRPKRKTHTMLAAKKLSTAALMWLIVMVAVELVVFQDVWWIMFAPPATMAILAINLGFIFLLSRLAGLETRIIGMLIGGLAACFVTAFGVVVAIAIGNRIQNDLVAWASAHTDQGSPTAGFLRLVARNLFVIGGVALDSLGVAMIWCGGRLESRWRRRRLGAAAAARVGSPPLDVRAASPL